MKFNYTAITDRSGPAGQSRRYIKYPLLRVRLAFGERSTDIVGLVDTGATDCIFDCDVADDLGISLKENLETRTYTGIAGQSVVGYIKKIAFRVEGFSEWIEIDAAFLESKLPYQLLGQSGLFDNYEVILRRYRGKFEVKSRSFLRR